MMKRIRVFLAVLCALSMTTTFGQDTADQVVKRKVAEIAGRYKDSKEANRDATTLQEFVTLSKEYPGSVEVNSWLGFLYLRTDEAEKAIPFLEKASTASPNDLEVLNNLGNAYMKARYKDKALATFIKLSEKDATKYQPFYNMGNYYLENREYSKAVNAFTKASELQKDRPQIINNLGVAYEGTRNWEKAASMFVRASDLEPSDSTFAQNAGVVLHKLERYASAATYLERALRSGNKDRSVVLTLADCYGKQKKTDQVSKLYVDNAGILGDDPDYYYNLGVMRRSAGDAAGAESAFKKAYQLRDTDQETILNLGALLFNKGDYEQSRLLFEKLMGLNPSPRNKRNFAAAASRSGDVKAAVPVWNDLLKVNPKDHEIRLLLADASYDEGDVKTALANYKLVVAAKPTSALALDGIGRCHIFNANYVAAEASLRSAINADSKFVPAYNNLAVALEKMNKRKEAISWLEKAASIEPNNADVLKNLKRMKSAG